MNNKISSPNVHTSLALAKCGEYAGLIAFNRQPSRYLHPSWRPEFVEAGLSAYLYGVEYAHAMLSDCIRKKIDLADIPDCDIAHPAVRIGMLLSAVQLRELACRIGAILIGQPIRHALSNAAVAAWIVALGEQLYRFTCKHAPLLGGAQFIDSAALDSPPLRAETVAKQLAATGFRFLSACSHRIDAAIGQRIRLKLPREYAQQPMRHLHHPHHIHHTSLTAETWTWIYRVWNSMPTHASPSITPDLAAYR